MLWTASMGLSLGLGLVLSWQPDLPHPPAILDLPNMLTAAHQPTVSRLPGRRQVILSSDEQLLTRIEPFPAVPERLGNHLHRWQRKAGDRLRRLRPATWGRLYSYRRPRPWRNYSGHSWPPPFPTNRRAFSGPAGPVVNRQTDRPGYSALSDCGRPRPPAAVRKAREWFLTAEKPAVQPSGSRES